MDFFGVEDAKTLARRAFATVRGGWCADCLIQGMANPTLAPEEDDFNVSRAHNFSLSKPDAAVVPSPSSEAAKVLISFNPKKIGFGILPWPGTDKSAPLSDTVAIAMQYLLEGTDHKAQGEKK